MKHIVITGGGSGGHIAPVLAVVPQLRKDYSLTWIGSTRFEKRAAHNLGVKYKRILSGKFRRYKSVKNITDMFRVGMAFFQSLLYLLRKRPVKVFSTGGFVSVPVVLAARLLFIPVVVHEQTVGLGLANKIGAFCAKDILLGFESSMKYLKPHWRTRAHVVGNPVRESLYGGNASEFNRFIQDKNPDAKPVLYITGGGQGSDAINSLVWENLDTLTKDFFVLHQVGKTGEEQSRMYRETKNYHAEVFITDAMKHIYACASVVIARSGAGTVNELAHFDIYSIFIPLRPTQNDEQTKNAQWFLENHHGALIHQKELSKEALIGALTGYSPDKKSAIGSDGPTALELCLNYLR